MVCAGRGGRGRPRGFRLKPQMPNKITESMRALRLRILTERYGEDEAMKLMTLSKKDRVKREMVLDHYSKDEVALKELHDAQTELIHLREVAVQAITNKNRLLMTV